MVTQLFHGWEIVVELSDVAMRAIQDGVARGDSVADLGFLGLRQKIIGTLEERGKIIYLEQLLNVSEEEFIEMRGLNYKSLREVLECLSRYHQLGKQKEKFLKQTRDRADVCLRCPQYRSLDDVCTMNGKICSLDGKNFEMPQSDG
jgi:hypothetical protein